MNHFLHQFLLLHKKFISVTMYVYIPLFIMLLLLSFFFHFKHINLLKMVDLYSAKNKFESAERQFISLRETLDRKTQEQGGILNRYTDNINLGNLERLTENSNELIRLIRNQNEVTENIFSLSKTTINLLQNSHENTLCNIHKDLNDLCKDNKILRKDIENLCKDNKILHEDIKNLQKSKEILCYRDWVGNLIEEVIKKLRLKKVDGQTVNGQAAWKIIASAFSTKIKYKKKIFEPKSRVYINLLTEILNEVDINLEEFELLMKFKWTGNNKFHVEKFQSEDEALEELTQFSFPNNLKCYKDSIKKSIIAVKIWKTHRHSEDDHSEDDHSEDDDI
jgi:hypothetical protein